MNRKNKWHDYLTINMNWFSLTIRSQILGLLIPLILLQFVGEAQKGEYFGKMRLWALMIALLSQALFGMLSDRNTSNFGRRRPYILIGTYLEIIVFFFIGLSLNLSGMTGFVVLFILYMFSMFFNNMSHAATQGLIPDLVSKEKRGIFSGVKALIELPVPIIFVSLVIGTYVSKGHYIGGLIALSVVMIICSFISMFAPEKKIKKNSVPPLDWEPFIRLVLMAGVFTILVLATGTFTQWLIPILNINSIIVSGAIGIVAMIFPAFLGVFFSTKIGFGKDENVTSSYVLWIMNRLLFLIAINNMTAFMTYYFMEKFPGVTANDAAGMTAKILPIVAIGMVVAAVPAGYLADKIGKKKLLYFAALLGVVGTGVLILLDDMVYLYIAGALFGVAASIIYSANWALGTTLIPENEAGKYLGISNLAGAGAGMIGAYIGGPFGDLPQAGFTVLMAIFGGMFLVAIIPLVIIKEK